MSRIHSGAISPARTIFFNVSHECFQYRSLIKTCDILKLVVNMSGRLEVRNHLRHRDHPAHVDNQMAKHHPLTIWQIYSAVSSLMQDKSEEYLQHKHQSITTIEFRAAETETLACKVFGVSACYKILV